MLKRHRGRVREGKKRKKEELEDREVGVETTSCTSAVPEVLVGGWVVLAEPLQDEFIVQQAVEGPEEEHVEGQVANSLLLKVSTESLHLPAGPEEMGHMFEAAVNTFLKPSIFHACR